MSDEVQKKFEEAVRPVMKFLAENLHPHTTIIITSTDAELLEGSASVVTDEYLVD